MSRPLRVAQVVATAGTSGVESHLLALLSAFDRREIETVAFLPRPGALADRLAERGIPVEYGAPSRKLAFAETRRLASRWRGAFEVVHAHGPRAAFWSAHAARGAGVPALVMTLHEQRWKSLPPGPKRALWVKLEAGVLERADRVIAVSTAVAESLIARMPHLRERVRVVLGTTPLLLEPARLPIARPFTNRGESMRLVAVGRLNWAKGYDRLLQALEILDRRGLPFVLDVVGTGELLHELRATVRRLGIVEKIRWHPASYDIPTLLSEADAFVTASRSEGLPIAPMEAMAIGLPVIGTDVGGMREVVTNGRTGVLLSPEPEGDLPGRFADALASWYFAPDSAARMGAEGARAARADFAPSRMAARIVEVYHSALAERSRTTPRKRSPDL